MHVLDIERKYYLKGRCTSKPFHSGAHVAKADKVFPSSSSFSKSLSPASSNSNPKNGLLF